MRNNHNAQARCAEMITTLGREWNLSPEQEAAYARAIVAYLPEQYTDAQLQRLVWFYHLDHQEVHILCDPQHPGHQEAWRNWHGQVIRILRSANLDWLADVAIDFEDLTQIALEVLSKSIASYRFNSRFSTWAYTVIIQSVRRRLRNEQAHKRSSYPLLHDLHRELDRLPSEADQPERAAMANELVALIEAILDAQPNKRLGTIFKLWMKDDMRTEEIAEYVKLSPSRVRALLAKARDVLREHPDIRAWLEAQADVLEPSGVRTSAAAPNSAGIP